MSLFFWNKSGLLSIVQNKLSEQIHMQKNIGFLLH